MFGGIAPDPRQLVEQTTIMDVLSLCVRGGHS